MQDRSNIDTPSANSGHKLSESLSQVVVTTSPQYLFLIPFRSKKGLYTVQSYHLRFFESQNPFEAARFCVQKRAAC